MELDGFEHDGDEFLLLCIDGDLVGSDVCGCCELVSCVLSQFEESVYALVVLVDESLALLLQIEFGGCDECGEYAEEVYCLCPGCLPPGRCDDEGLCGEWSPLSGGVGGLYFEGVFSWWKCLVGGLGLSAAICGVVPLGFDWS